MKFRAKDSAENDESGQWCKTWTFQKRLPYLIVFRSEKQIFSVLGDVLRSFFAFLDGWIYFPSKFSWEQFRLSGKK